MKTLSLLLLSVAGLFGADPACLSGPVTQGSVTITCAAIDNTAYGATTDTNTAGYYFQVKATSTDPEVIGARIGVTWQQTFDPKELPMVSTRWVIVNKTDAGFAYSFILCPVFDGLQKTVPFSVTAVRVQEMKASSTHTF